MQRNAVARARDLGITPGFLPPGPLNAITDVTGVRVGHRTVIEGEGVRTGVTAILPNDGDIFMDRVVGGGFVLNGAGEVSGLTQVMEWGLIETPILLTNTLSVGAVSEGCVRYMVDKHPSIGKQHDVIIPVVGECDDSWLNDIAVKSVHEHHVLEAIQNASDGPVLEGCVGGGTGMITCDFKGGIGTSSRRVVLNELQYNLGVLVMSNFGVMNELRMDGVPVGALLEPDYEGIARRTDNYGSIIVVVATDAPLLPVQLQRVCKRAALGVGRVGSFAAHGSGEIMIAFSTGNRVPRETERHLAQVNFLLDSSINAFYQAAVEATEEAILNALCAATDMRGVEGHYSPSLPLDRVQQIMAAYARTASELRGG
ncbi:DmpA family aminopeptidase [Enhygromyxa salina]|uniref:Peptidase family S58 n=1 Tax=Enhygromyxa salina TaxID=215803 RepID=A0A2S9YXS1_9BACT|nr:Peptidase family S58 [Enhygromyxa salina]